MMAYVKVILVLSIVAQVGLSNEITSQSVASCRNRGYYYISGCIGSCYRIVTTQHDWFFANIFCSWTGGHLVAIESLEEQAYLAYIMQGKDDWIWTSGNELATKHRWEWQGWNTRFTFTQWWPGEPDDYNGVQERCMGIAGDRDFKWIDLACHTKRKLICERKL